MRKVTFTNGVIQKYCHFFSTFYTGSKEENIPLKPFIRGPENYILENMRQEIYAKIGVRVEYQIYSRFLIDL